MPLTLGAIGEGLVELGLRRGEDNVELGYGGDAANTAVMASNAGVPARLCGRIGADAFGRRLSTFWRARGLDLTHVMIDLQAPTGFYTNELGSAGTHRFDYHRRESAGMQLRRGDVDDAFLDDLGVLYTTGVTLAISDTAAETARALAIAARERHVPVAFGVNHRPALGSQVGVVLGFARLCDVVFLSAEEGETLLGSRQPHEIVERLKPAAADPIVIVSDGVNGATLVAPARRLVAQAPAPPTHVVDAAGAGDCLAGAFLAGQLRGITLEDSLCQAVAAASRSCEARGCARSYPIASERQ